VYLRPGQGGVPLGLGIGGSAFVVRCVEARWLKPILNAK
jgi:hypothetical protein